MKNQKQEIKRLIDLQFNAVSEAMKDLEGTFNLVLKHHIKDDEE